MEYVKMESNGSELTFFLTNPDFTITVPIKHPDAAHAVLSRTDLGLSNAQITAWIAFGLGREVFES